MAGNVQDRQVEGQVGREVALRAISCVCAYGASTREIGTAFRHARGLEESRLSGIKTERAKHVQKLEMRLWFDKKICPLQRLGIRPSQEHVS